MTQIKFISTDYGSQLETETNRWIAAMSKKYKDEFEVEDIKFISNHMVMIIFEIETN